MPVDDARFVSLAQALRSPAPETLPLARPESVLVDPPPHVPTVVPAAQNEPLDAQPPLLERLAPEYATAVRAARVFHAAIGDALDAIVADLTREIAVEIVARELRLAEADIAAIARRLLAERFADEPLRIRVSPADAAIVCDLPVTVDPALEPGDAILECRDGSIDARLGVRLAALLQAPQA